MPLKRQTTNYILLIILLSYFMIILDISIVFIALPTMLIDFNLSTTTLVWVSNGYTLMFGSSLLLCARLGDKYGKCLMLTLGLFIFTLASLGIGLTNSVFVLISCRLLQGLSAAIIAPTTMSLLQVTFTEEKERIKAVAYYGAVAGFGSSFGLILGGILTTTLSWRAGFLINIPIGITLVSLAIIFIPETPKQTLKLDVTGALLSTIAIGLLVYALYRLTQSYWTDAITILLLIASLTFTVLFIIIQRKSSNPILPLIIFNDKARNSAYISRFFYLAAMISFWFFTTMFLQKIYQLTPFQAAIAYLPMTLVHFISAILIPKLNKLITNHQILTIGITLTLIGMASLSVYVYNSHSYQYLLIPMVLIGIGQGMTLGPLTLAGIKNISKTHATSASGIMNVAHQIGGCIGLSITVMIYQLSLNFINNTAQNIAFGLFASSTFLLLVLFTVLFLHTNKQKSI